MVIVNIILVTHNDSQQQDNKEMNIICFDTLIIIFIIIM